MKSVKQEELELRKRIGRLIKFLRKVAGIKTQAQFGKLMGTRRSNAAKLETGDTGISLTRIIKISRLLKVDAMTLLLGAPCEKTLSIILNLKIERNLDITEVGLLCKKCAMNDVPSRRYIIKLLEEIQR